MFFNGNTATLRCSSVNCFEENAGGMKLLDRARSAGCKSLTHLLKAHPTEIFGLVGIEPFANRDRQRKRLDSHVMRSEIDFNARCRGGAKRRGWDLNPRDLAIIGLAIRRHTRLPDPSYDLLATPAYTPLETLLSHKIEFCSRSRVTSRADPSPLAVQVSILLDFLG